MIVPKWGRFETRLTARLKHDEPVSGVRVDVEFTHESGASRSVEGFWDGGANWTARFSPDSTGQWSWRTCCAEDNGLDGASGEFECESAESSNPLYRRGRIQIAQDRRHFQHADGTPLYWLGDTAWNGPLKSSAEDWETYLDDRAAKGFNVIQFVATHWLAAAGDAAGRRAYNGTNPIHIDPEFFHRLDRRVNAINEHGMIAAPVLAWTANWNPDALDLNPGTALAEEQIVTLAKYIVARYGGHQVVWILAGDGDYRGVQAERWRRIGRAVFGGQDQLATMHPGGLMWVAGEFDGEPWFHFNGYQSGHWREESETWITQGPPSSDWKSGKPRPHINLEFCYESHEDFVFHRPFDARDVRRAAWKSLLAGPPCGLTYGCHGVWNWDEEATRPMNHPNTGIARPWREAIHLPGSDSMRSLKAVIAPIEWWRLRPCSDLVLDGLERAIPAARSEAADLALLYLPEGGSVPLRMDLLRPGLVPRSVDPATGESCAVAVDGNRFTPTGSGDRVLLLQPGPRKEE